VNLRRAWLAVVVIVALWAMFVVTSILTRSATHECNGPTGVYTNKWGQQHVESYDPACTDPSVIQ
jgi:hypothetical protein